MKVKVLVTQSRPTFCDPMDYSPQAPLSMGFPRQGYWSGWPFPSPGGIPDSGIEPSSPGLQADSLQSEPPENPKQCITNAKLLVLTNVPWLHKISASEKW